jgi:hypothetical protein
MVEPDSTYKSKKKPITSYLWEFIMLFLAVFCGFIAENLREQQVEKQVEQTFIKTFIEDLKIDTAALSNNMQFRKKKIEQLDSLIYLFGHHKIKGYENDLYYYGRLLIRTSRFQSNDRTITQLKHSGSLRLISKEQAADSMIAYQKLIETIAINHEDERIERTNTNMQAILIKLFNPFVFDTIMNISGIHRPDHNPPLRSYDPGLQQDLAFYIHLIKGSNYIILSREDLLYTKAKNIIALLEKEYQLSDNH